MQFLIFLGALQICDRAQNTDGFCLLLHIFTFSSAKKQNDRITVTAVCLFDTAGPACCCASGPPYSWFRSLGFQTSYLRRYYYRSTSDNSGPRTLDVLCCERDARMTSCRPQCRSLLSLDGRTSANPHSSIV